MQSIMFLNDKESTANYCNSESDGGEKTADEEDP